MSNIDPGITELLERYGDGADGSAPTPDQWRRLLDYPSDTPITLINFFELRSVADYGGSQNTDVHGSTGAEAMMRYASVSGPALESVGGRFLLTAPFAGTVIGPEEGWDMVAIGSYPSRDALLALFDDAAYAAAFAHRRAAVERQRVVAVSG